MRSGEKEEVKEEEVDERKEETDVPPATVEKESGRVGETGAGSG